MLCDDHNFTEVTCRVIFSSVLRVNKDLVFELLVGVKVRVRISRSAKILLMNNISMFFRVVQFQTLRPKSTLAAYTGFLLLPIGSLPRPYRQPHLSTFYPHIPPSDFVGTRPASIRTT